MATDSITPGNEDDYITPPEGVVVPVRAQGGSEKGKGKSEKVSDDEEAAPLPKPEAQELELAEGLSELRAQADLPEDEEEALKAKVVRVDKPLREMILKVTAYLQTGRYKLYRRAYEIGTIDEESGEWRAMDAHRFRSWLTLNCGILTIKGFAKTDREDKNGRPVMRPIEEDMPLDIAASILKSDELRNKLPLLEHVHRVKLPVMRDAVDENGRRRIELLQPGYDAESKTLTLLGSLDYDEEMDPEAARRHLQGLLRFFPWADATPDEVTGRSVAIQIAAMLTVFCARMFRGRSPLFLWNANMPDSGKSRLAQLCIQPVHGHAGRAGFSYKDRKEVKQELDACAQSFGDYIFFDDLPRGRVVNEDLHRWLTAPEWSCRILGTKELFRGRLFAATLMTGNEVRLNEDLERRTLQLDLFAKVSGRDRVLPDSAVLIDDDFFADEKEMEKIIASLWALVRWWDMLNRPKTKCRPLNSFEGWSRLVPAIVEACRFGNALAPFDAPDSGNEEGRELRKLMTLVLHELVAPLPVDWPVDEAHDTVVELRKITALARRNRFFQERLLTIEGVIAGGDERGGFKFKEPGKVVMEGYEVRATALIAAEQGKTVEELDENDWGITDRAKDLAREDQAAEWLGTKIGSWWGKFFKKRAANGLIWRGDGGDVFEVGSRGNTDLSKIVLRRLPKVVG